MRPETRTILDNLLDRFPQLSACGRQISRAYEAMLACATDDGMILVCGNGGSAADADHIVGELVKSFRLPRPLPPKKRHALEAEIPQANRGVLGQLQQGIRAISLVGQAALVTALGNDVSQDLIFAQQVFVYGRSGDVLLGLSTSGNATNVVNAVALGRAAGITTIGLTGGTGGRLGDLCHIPVVVPATETYEIQELHVPIYHALCAMLEAQLFGG